MRKTKSKSSAKRDDLPLNWDGLIDIAQAQLRQIEVKSEQLSALIRFLRSRKEAGEPSPLEALNSCK
jgi:hypothetical protein